MSNTHNIRIRMTNEDMLKEIAHQITGVDTEDLTICEKSIAEVLKNGGFLVVKEFGWLTTFWNEYVVPE